MSENTNIVTCPNGHRYNSLLYDHGCPICGQESLNQKEEDRDCVDPAFLNPQKDQSTTPREEANTEKKGDKLFKNEELSKEKTKILNFLGHSQKSQESESVPEEEEGTRILDKSSKKDKDRVFSAVDHEGVKTVILKQNQKGTEPSKDEEKTQPNAAKENAKEHDRKNPVSKSEEEGKTILFYNQRQYTVEPVYGWLVCFDGADRGRDFRVLAGMNRIGRFTDDERGISLADPSISRDESAAIIAFDPRNKQFLISPGKSNHSLVLVNEATLLRQNLLSAFDLITIGNSSFVFVPLCGDRFLWKDEAEK